MPPELHIPLPAHFSFRECLWFLDRGFDDCLHKVQGNSVTKLLRIGNQGHSLLRITGDSAALRVERLAGGASAEQIGDFVSEWFDLQRDIQPLKVAAGHDPQLLALVERYWGLRLISIPDLFEVLCWSIIGQQINLKFAYKLKRALVEAVGESYDFEADTYHVFPTPEQVLQLTFDDLKAMQYSSQKARYLHMVANEFLSGGLSKEALLAMPTTQHMLNRLMSIKGIGEWTANYAAMKCLRRPDAITYGDAGLLNGYKALKGMDRKPLRSELEEFFRLFPDWEAYVVFYIWRSLS